MVSFPTIFKDSNVRLCLQLEDLIEINGTVDGLEFPEKLNWKSKCPFQFPSACTDSSLLNGGIHQKSLRIQ